MLAFKLRTRLSSDTDGDAAEERTCQLLARDEDWITQVGYRRRCLNRYADFRPYGRFSQQVPGRLAPGLVQADLQQVLGYGCVSFSMAAGHLVRRRKRTLAGLRSQGSHPLSAAYVQAWGPRAVTVCAKAASPC